MKYLHFYFLPFRLELPPVTSDIENGRIEGSLENEGSNLQEKSFDVIAQVVAKGKQNKKSKEKFDWKDDVVEELINMWQNQPLLFNVNHPCYHVKEKRRNCINNIISCMDDMNIAPLPSYDEVYRKLNALRSYYVAEKNKTEQSKVSGAGTSNVYKSKWQFYDNLSFLSDNVTPRGTTSNAGKRNLGNGASADGDYAYQVENSPSAKSARKMEVYKTNQLIETAITALNKPKEPYIPPANVSKTADQLFAEMIGKLLETIDEGQAKDFLKMEIQKLVYETKYSTPKHNMFHSLPNSFPQAKNVSHNLRSMSPSYGTLVGQEAQLPSTYGLACGSPQMSHPSSRSSNSSYSRSTMEGYDPLDGQDYTEL